MALFTNEAQFFSDLGYSSGHVTPHFLAVLAKVYHYPSAWQVLKKSVQCMWEILGENVLKTVNELLLMSCCVKFIKEIF